MGRRWLLWLLFLTAAAVLAAAFSGFRGAPATGPALDAFVPVGGGLKRFAAGIAGVWDTLGRAATLSDENERLAAQVRQLQNEIIRLQEAGEENRRLRALLDYERDNPGRNYLAADIIAFSPDNLVQSAVINRGTEQGVQKGMVVVSDFGLVGKVVDVSGSGAKLRFVTDPSSVVNATVQRSRVSGVITGRSDGMLDLLYVDKDADVQEGDILLTSGLGGGFPRSVPIAAVKSVASKDQDLFKQVLAEPLAKRSTLDTVLVITDFTPVELR